MFKVVSMFRDKDGTVYQPNDEYKGDMSAERLETLTTKNNEYEAVFLAAVDPTPPKKTAKPKKEKAVKEEKKTAKKKG